MSLQEVNLKSPGTPASLPPSSQWALSVPPDRALPRRVVAQFLSETESAAAASAVAKGLLQQTEDSVGLLQLRRVLKSAAKKMEARSQAFAKQVDDTSISHALAACSDATLHIALEALRAQVELLRGLKEEHTAILKLEVETSNRDALRKKIAEVIEGRGLHGSDKFRGLSHHELQAELGKLKEDCLALRSKKAYFANQLSEARGKRRVPQQTQTQQDLHQGLEQQQQQQQQRSQHSQKAAEIAAFSSLCTWQ
uniref:Uncharacterized protein n=1 Tax=Dunaliella tertiolecta TaxID=3047 RepID=A0A7S3QNZ5_DUNTE